jgi:hypothetical protein
MNKTTKATDSWMIHERDNDGNLCMNEMTTAIRSRTIHVARENGVPGCSALQHTRFRAPQRCLLHSKHRHLSELPCCQRNIETELWTQGPDGKPLARSTLGGVPQENKKWEAIFLQQITGGRKYGERTFQSLKNT